MTDVLHVQVAIMKKAAEEDGEAREGAGEPGLMRTLFRSASLRG